LSEERLPRVRDARLIAWGATELLLGVPSAMPGRLATLKARLKALAETSDAVECPSCRRLMRVKRYNVKVLCPHCSSILYVASKDRVQVVARGVYKPSRLTSPLSIVILFAMLSTALAIPSNEVGKALGVSLGFLVLGFLIGLLATLWALASHNLVPEARER